GRRGRERKVRKKERAAGGGKEGTEGGKRKEQKGKKKERKKKKNVVFLHYKQPTGHGKSFGELVLEGTEVEVWNEKEGTPPT
ncbi:hypothetical protein, partial [Enterococcus faecalis]|uniref:hypothetical protein n=1 Tax=Enterococcus faecalis TaxID=1351 RepID=UPI003D6A9937